MNIKMETAKYKLAWVEDNNEFLANNVFFLYDTGNGLFEIETFREDFDPLATKNNYIDLKLAKEMLTKTQKYGGIILDDMLLTENVYPLDGMEVGEHLLKEVGEHLLKDIRSRDSINKKTPVIMYTDGKGELEKLRLYKKLGANIWMPKSPMGFLQDDIKTNARILKRTKQSLELMTDLQSLRNIKEELPKLEFVKPNFSRS